MDIYLKAISGNYFTRPGSNLIRPNLFSVDTKVYLMDPAVFSPLGIYSSAVVAASQVIYNDDFSQVATNILNTAWASSGWNTANINTFSAQMKVWADNNLPITVPGYNLVASMVSYEQPPIYSFENTGLETFTYNDILGEVSYDNPVNLSSVMIGHKFRDSLNVIYNVIGVNDATDTITIRDNLNQIPASIDTTVLISIDGAIYADLGGAVTNYSMAFFYSGNQGPLIP